MSVIKITVDEQNLHITDSPKIAAQGVNENYVEFTFSEDWTGFGKVALFYREKDEDTVYESVIDGTNKALVPHEVTDQDGKICIGVAGVKDNVIHTSEILKYKIVKGLYTAGESSEPPTPGIYEQMLTLAQHLQSLYEDLEADQQDFEASVNNTLANTPYLYYEEDENFELPVHTINDSEIAASSTWSSAKIIDMIYPVGAIFMSVVDTNPSTYLGGTWVAWGTGRVPVGIETSQTEFNTVEKTGGEKTHTLTANEIPSHHHSYDKTTVGEAFTVNSDTPGSNFALSSLSIASTNSGNTGGGGAHNNLQPYITCYMFKRTA